MTFAPIVSAAERRVSLALARDIQLGDVVQLSDERRRNLLLRASVLSTGSPASVIIKKVVADAYNPEDAASWDAGRFLRDWVGAEFLSTTLDTPLSPRFYGGDRSSGLFILEDLGEHRSLVEPLLGGDPASAERALLAFSASLGKLHGGTVGQMASYERFFHAVTPHAAALSHAVDGIGERVSRFKASVEGLGIHIEASVHGEIEAVVAAIEDPGPFSSYIHGDPCPDNVFWDGDTLRLIDFEFGGFGHALLDAAYGRMLFPSCWCASRLPEDLVSRTEAVYRGELSKKCSEAQDDRIFESALAAVCGFWVLNSVSRSLESALESDRTWGISTVRQRLLSRLEAFITTAEDCAQLPAVRGMASRLLEVLQKSWPDTPPMPLYPAFQRASAES